MDLRQLPMLNALRTFEAAARHESFSRAADELFVTHGAVSHQIRALEDELGTPLFLREGKRVRLTDVGCRYAKDVRTALNGGTLPGTTYEQSQAYTAYIRRLQHGTAGFTCFASLQMPRG